MATHRETRGNGHTPRTEKERLAMEEQHFSKLHIAISTTQLKYVAMREERLRVYLAFLPVGHSFIDL